MVKKYENYRISNPMNIFPSKEHLITGTFYQVFNHVQKKLSFTHERWVSTHIFILELFSLYKTSKRVKLVEKKGRPKGRALHR